MLSRASSAPIQDLFITLLSMGAEGYRELLQEREENLEHLRSCLGALAEAHGERLLEVPGNRISLGLTLDTFEEGPSADVDVTYLGSQLFTRCISGTRVIRRGETKRVCGHDLQGFGSSCNDYPHTYMTAACAVGLRRSEIDRFVEVLGKTMISFKTKRRKDAEKRERKTAQETAADPATGAAGAGTGAAEEGRCKEEGGSPAV